MISSICVNTQIKRITFLPGDEAAICVSGHQCCKMYRIGQDSVMKTVPIFPAKIDQHESFEDHCWASNFFITITTQGKVYVFSIDQDVSTLKQQFQLDIAPFSQLTCVGGSEKGFTIGGTMGIFDVYELTKNPKEPYMSVKQLNVPEQNIVEVLYHNGSNDILIYTQSHEILNYPIGKMDMIEDARQDLFEPGFYRGFHNGGIIALDCCYSRPIVISCASDKILKIWNYYTGICEVSQELNEEITCLSLHPSGSLLAIGARECINIYHVLKSSILLFQPLSCKHSTVIKFSNGGHFLACSSGIVIHIYHTYSLQQLMTYTGHISTITCIRWKKDDSELYSCGIDGAVYVWSISQRRRLDEFSHVVKTCRYSCLSIGSHSRVITAVGSDCKIRTIFNGEANTISTGNIAITNTLLTEEDRFMICGTSQGSVRVYTYPVAGENYQEVFVHNGSVTALAISSDSRFVFSGGADGSIFAFSLKPLEGPAIALSPSMILPAWIDIQTCTLELEDYDDKISTIEILKKNIEAINTDHKFVLNREKALWNDKLKNQQEDYEKELADERKKYDLLQGVHETYLREVVEEKEKDDSENVKFIQELESQYEHKLAAEMERYDRLSEEKEMLRQQMKEIIEDQKKYYESKITELENSFNIESQSYSSKITKLHEDIKYNATKFEEVLAQQENEYEGEILAKKMDAEAKLSAEQELTVKKANELNIQQTKNEELRKRMAKMKADETKYLNEKANLLKKQTELKDTIVYIYILIYFKIETFGNAFRC